MSHNISVCKVVMLSAMTYQTFVQFPVELTFQRDITCVKIVDPHWYYTHLRHNHCSYTLWYKFHKNLSKIVPVKRLNGNDKHPVLFCPPNQFAQEIIKVHISWKKKM